MKPPYRKRKPLKDPRESSKLSMRKLRARRREEAKPMNTIILLIGRRLIGAIEREMKAIDEEIKEHSH